MVLLWYSFCTSFLRRFLVADWFTTRRREAELSHVVETRFYGISQHYHGYTYITLPSNHLFDSLINYLLRKGYVFIKSPNNHSFDSLTT